MSLDAKSKYWSRRFRRNSLSLALGMCLLAGQVNAQSVTGTIFGDAAAGSTVVIQNVDTGVSHTVTADANGRYSATALPTGRYKVILQQAGNMVAERDARVVAGQGTEVGFADGAEASLDAVTVVGLNTIDTSTVESKLTLTKELLDKLPVAANLTQIALLAPGVIAGDSRYGNIAVFTGSSASENAYYINGFPVTQSLTQFGYTELPYNSVDQTQVSTGGYGVEYGRATGGVVSVITASGSNEWQAGGQIIYRPSSLRADARDIYYGPNGRSGLAWGNAGQIARYNGPGPTYKNLSVYTSGALVQDRLFFYAAGEFVESEGGNVQTTSFASSASAVNTARTNAWSDAKLQLPRWLGKVDWYINDDHRIELTGLQDRRRESEEYSGFDYATFERVGGVVGGYERDRDTHTYIANYTGYLTDNLTLSAMYGKSKSEYEGGPINYNPNCPSISIAAGAQAPGLNYTTCQLSSAPDYLDGRFDKHTAMRFDVEYRLGDDHTLKAGWDGTEAESLVGSADDTLNYPGALGISFAGGYQWTYYRADDPNEPIYEPQGVGSPASGGGLGNQGYYVVRDIGSNLSRPNVEQTAQYIKDLWQVSDNVLLELGLRNEQFENYASDGTAFIDFNKQLAPRLGATWDVFGDASTKLYASAGRYHLALPNNVARRGVDGATNTSEAFVYSGVDPVTGAPTGLVSLGPVYSENNEFGQGRDGRSFAPTSLKSHYQDTFAVGAERNFSWLDNEFNAGAKLTHSSLGSAIDDFCDSRPVYEWAETAEGSQYTEAQIDELADFIGHCVLINPGEDNTYRYDIDGDGTYDDVHLTKEMLGFPKLKRDYVALDMFLERPFDGTWYARVDYTLSKLKGNLEGQLNSDIGQIDVSTTLAGDYYELAVNSSGYLPNDRRHQFKVNGFYQLTEELGISGLFTWASGRPQNCRGAFPNIDPASPNYGSYHFFCNGQPVPRGTFGRLPPTARLDLGLRYMPKWASGLELGLNIYNVANRQSVQNVAELYNQGASATTINANWGRPVSFSAPRYLEFVLRYDWGSDEG